MLTILCRWGHIACGLERFLACWFIGICRHQSCLYLVFPPAYGQFFCDENKPSLCFSLSSSLRPSIYPYLPHFPSSCLSCLSLPLCDTYSTRALTLGESCSHDWTWLTQWIRHEKLYHTHWGWAAAIDHWATALKYNEGIQNASGDGYLPSGQIFDTQSRTLVGLLCLLFVTRRLAICDRSQIIIMSTTSCSRSNAAYSICLSWRAAVVGLKAV